MYFLERSSKSSETFSRNSFVVRNADTQTSSCTDTWLDACTICTSSTYAPQALLEYGQQSTFD